jgi:glycosyltransferase involved in cell wall biosynthesis
VINEKLPAPSSSSDSTRLVELFGPYRYITVSPEAPAVRNVRLVPPYWPTVNFAQPQGDPVRAMRSADIFVRPAIDKKFHADSLQALGSGMAVVAVPGGVGDHLRNGETARICRAGSAEALAESIEELLTNRTEARELAASGLEYVRQNHGMSAMAEGTAATYRELAVPRTNFSLRT